MNELLLHSVNWHHVLTYECRYSLSNFAVSLGVPVIGDTSGQRLFQARLVFVFVSVSFWFSCQSHLHILSLWRVTSPRHQAGAWPWFWVGRHVWGIRSVEWGCLVCVCKHLCRREWRWIVLYKKWIEWTSDLTYRTRTSWTTRKGSITSTKSQTLIVWPVWTYGVGRRRFWSLTTTNASAPDAVSYLRDTPLYFCSYTIKGIQSWFRTSNCLSFPISRFVNTWLCALGLLREVTSCKFSAKLCWTLRYVLSPSWC